VRPDPLTRQALRSYADLGFRGRLHTWARAISCPFDQVEALVPRSGDILDLGCGHGLFSIILGLGSPDRRVHGVDIDADKVVIGRRAVTDAGLDDRVALEVVAPDWRPSRQYSGVACNDVLYLLGRERAQDLLSGVAASLAPGAVAVVKEVGETPGWKHTVNELQERLATQVLRYTAGDHLEVLAIADIEAPFDAAGLRVRRVPMDAGYLHAHVAVVAERPASV